MHGFHLELSVENSKEKEAVEFPQVQVLDKVAYSVGFYSAYLASDKVCVVSKNEDDAKCADKSDKTVKD